MSRKLRTSALIRRRLANSPTLQVERRAKRPFLEILENRLALSSYTWIGGTNQDWDTPANWQKNLPPPLTGTNDIFFDNTGAQTVFLDSDDANLQINSLTLEGGSITLQGPSTSDDLPLDLANGVTIDSGDGSTLTFCPSQAATSGENSLALNFLGSATVEGVEVQGIGGVYINNQQNNPPPTTSPAPKRPITIGTGKLTLGSSTGMIDFDLHVDAGGTIIVPDTSLPRIGSLSGIGTVELEGNPGDNSTGLDLNPPQSESDEFNGEIEGTGGTISMQGAGTQSIADINYDPATKTIGSGAFQLNVSSGTLLVNDAVYTGTYTEEFETVGAGLTVASTANFGGPGIMDIAGQSVFSGSSTFGVSINGALPADYGNLINDDSNSEDGGTGIVLTGSNLSVNVASGYDPPVGTVFTIMKAASLNTSNFTIQDQFANAPDGAVIPFDGVPFLVNYEPDADNATSVTLTAVAWTTTTSVSLGSGSINPATYGQAVTLDASVQVSGNVSATATGTVAFYDGNPNAGGTEIGSQALSAGNASFTTAGLSASGSPHTIYAVYAPNSIYFDNGGPSHISQTINKAPLTITADNESKTGGQSFTFDGTEFNVNGLVNGDTVTSVTLTSPGAAATATATGSPYAITPSGAVGTGLANYTITYDSGMLSVTFPLATVDKATVQNIRTRGRTTKVIVLQFSEALNLGDAGNKKAYSLVTIPKNKRRTGTKVVLATATYDPTTFKVTLRTSRPLVLNPPIQLTVKAASVFDALGRELDGTNSGEPGGNYVTIL